MGPFLVTQAFYPLLKKRNTRTVVNISSTLGSISTNRSGKMPLDGKRRLLLLQGRAEHACAPRHSGSALPKVRLGCAV